MSQADVGASFDPVTSGCETGGVPIYFASACVDYRVVVDPGWLAAGTITEADANTFVEEEFARWTSVKCATEDGATVGVGIEVRNVAGAKGGCPGSSGENEVRFMDIVPGSDGANPLTLGITRNSKRELSGVIEKSVTEIYPQAASGIDGSKAQVRGVLRHELGHFLGMGHSDVASAVMYFQSDSGAKLPTLTDDDVAGMCDAYSKEHPVGAGCSAADPTPPSPLFAFLALGLVVRRRLARSSLTDAKRAADPREKSRQRGPGREAESEPCGRPHPER